MNAIHYTARLVIVVFICASLTKAQGSSQGSEVRKMLIIADNQEHLLTGGPLRSFSSRTERLITAVGLRSPLANVGGRLLMREILKFGKEQGAGFVLHMGDAVDISCEKELKDVFDALDKEAPDKMWFMTPGNHDGLLAGNLANFQIPKKFIPNRPSFYNTPPFDGYGAEKNVWFYACQAPEPELGKELARSDMIRLYVDYLLGRPGVTRTWEHEICRTKDGGEGPCTVEGISVPCKIERIKIDPKKTSNPSAIDGYQAIARTCEAQPVPGTNRKVGQYASFIVQKIDVGGTRIVLLDTSDYIDPTEKILKLFPIAFFDGGITPKQKDLADTLFKRDDDTYLDSRNVIVAGHHPFDQLPDDIQQWVAGKSNRYISAHAHHSTSLLVDNIDRPTRLELNVGSTVDYPPQAVMAVMAPDFMSVRVAGHETNWDTDFLEQCRSMEHANNWLLDEKFYKNYQSGLYVKHLIGALKEAARIHDDRIKESSFTPKIPSGKEKGDWERLYTALEAINDAKGESRRFWACQAYYASKATQKERGFLAEQLAPAFGFGFKGGRPITQGWVSFSSP